MTKVQLKGHKEVCLAGTNFQGNEKYVFDVPDEFADILIRQHGGQLAANVLTEAEEKAVAEQIAKQKAEDDAINAELEKAAEAPASRKKR